VAPGKSPEEVVVTFQYPYADWRGLFSPLYPASLNASPSAFNGGWITGTVVSAGPFKFQGFDPTAQTVTIVRDPHWWGAAPALGSIVFHAYGGDVNAELTALKKGQIDFATITPDAAQLRTAQGIPNTTVRTAGGPEFRQLTFNGTSPNLVDIRVRQAIALSIDRTALAKTMLSPLGVPDADLNNHIYMTNQSGYQDNAGQFSSQDLSKAGTLLDQAGWKLVNGKREKNGQPLQIRLLISSQAPEAPQEANQIKSMIQATGVQVLVQTVPGAEFFPNYIGAGDFDLAIFSWEGTDFPITDNETIYLNPAPGLAGQLSIGENYARIGSPAIDQLLAEASSQLDPTKQIQLGNEVDAQVWQEVHSLTLYQRPEIYVERSTLANYGAFGFATPDYLTMGFTKS
jgi:peptide/nickel transport system substrate-binding protein